MKQTIEQLLTECEYDPNVKPTPDSVVYRIEQRNIGSLGNFIILSGLPKRGKGKFTAAMTASALHGVPVWGQHIHLPEHKRRIGFFDTDQSRYDFYKNIDLINELADLQTISPNLKAYNVRRHEPQTIITLIDQFLKLYPDCGMIIIDNIGDLLNNFNDEGQSKNLINYLKRITDEKSILIIATLHLGKSNNSTIGHLGAMADRYAQSILTCEKIGVQYHLKLKDSRTAAEFTPIAIYYNEFSNQWQETTPATDDQENANVKKLSKARPKDISDDEHKHKMRLMFGINTIMKQDELSELIKEFYPGVGFKWAGECIAHCRESGIINRIPEGYTMEKQTRLSIIN